MSEDKIVLSFRDSLLRESDVEILKGPRWFNDTLISFYFEYLTVVTKNPSILYVSPEVTQCIKVVSVSEVSVFLDPLSANKKDFIFFVLNDNERTDCSGGSHWSLLVFSRPEMKCFHFDSHSGSNYNQACDLHNKLKEYFEFVYRPLIEPKTLQQSNGYDCGVHVLCNTELISHSINMYHVVEGCGMVNKVEVMNKRDEFLQLIREIKGP